MSAERSWPVVPVCFSLALLVFQAFPLPGAVMDIGAEAWAKGFRLEFPLLHVVFSPFCGPADLLTVMSLRQLIVALFYILGGYFAWRIFQRRKSRPPWAREVFFFLAFFVLLLLYGAWDVWVPRPMARLMADDPDTLLIDFHSHTDASHDGHRGFGPSRNMAWHRAQGFHAAFITDHNKTEGARQAKILSRRTISTPSPSPLPPRGEGPPMNNSLLSWAGPVRGGRGMGEGGDRLASPYFSLEGEELSLFKTHLVVLGVHERVDNRPFDSDPAKIVPCVKEMRRRGYVVIASLPEYWKHHWNGSVQDFWGWGVDGFEILTGAPQALDFPSDKRRFIINECRRRGLFIVGASDTHGFGYATAVWNAMRVPGWRALDPDPLEAAVLRGLRQKKFAAVQVLSRIPRRSDTPLALALDTPASLILHFRSLTFAQAVSWMAWIWGAGWVCQRRKTR